MKKLLCVSFALALALALTACGAPKTGEELIERTGAALKKTPCTESTTHTEMTFSVTFLGVTLDTSVRTEEHGYFSADPAIAHVTSTTKTETVGATETTEEEYYALEEGGTPTVYSLLDGNWERRTENVPARTAEIFLPTSNLTFDPEATEELNGTTVYVLTGTASAADMGAEVAGMLTEGETSDVEMDVAALSAEVKLYIDTKTFLPVRMEGTLLGLDEALHQYLDSQMEEAMSGAGDALDLLEGADLSQIFSMELGDAPFVFDYVSYAPGEAITLPKEAGEAA